MRPNDLVRVPQLRYRMTHDGIDLSRRCILRVTGGTAAGLTAVGAVGADENSCSAENNGHGQGHGDESGHGDGHGAHEECPYKSIATHGDMHMAGDHDEEEHEDGLQEIMCPEHPHATSEPGHTMHHVNASMGGCPTDTGLEPCGLEDADFETINESWPDCTDWPQETIDLVKASREALTSPMYNDPGSLLVLGYVPYFDVVLPGADGGVSHWLHPGYINDTSYEPDPWRPESIVMDNEWWKPLGPMYIATDEGNPRWADEDEEIMEVREAWGYENECGECFPFHPHDGLPGRFAWWVYRQAYEADYQTGEEEDLSLPCYTAPMMHSWIYPTPHGPHGDTGGAPPQRYRPGGPPNTPGLPMPATPGEDELSLEALPEPAREVAMPARLERELEIVDELSRETLETTPIAELEALMDERLGPVGDDLDAAGDMERALADDRSTATDTGGLATPLDTDDSVTPTDTGL